MIEKWRDIPGYGGKYQANTEGDIRRVYPSGKTRLMTAYKKRMKGSQRMIVKLTCDGKSKEVVAMQVIARTFLGECPEGYVPYHKNGVQSDNYANNIAYVRKSELGRMTGGKSRRKPVVKIDSSGEIIECYPSAREAARKNYLSYQTVIDRCDGKCRSAFAPDGYAYAWEDREASIRWALGKIRERGKEQAWSV